MRAVIHITALTVALFLVATGASAMTKISLCSHAACGCQPPAVLTEGRQFSKTVDGKMCMCFCGADLHESCATDGQCTVGHFCKFEYTSSDASFATTGKCADNCDRKNCPQFHECSSGKTEATCDCSLYACDAGVLVPVCANTHDSPATQRFNNTCLFVNEQCERSKKGLSQLRSFACPSS